MLASCLYLSAFLLVTAFAYEYALDILPYDNSNNFPSSITSSRTELAQQGLEFLGKWVEGTPISEDPDPFLRDCKPLNSGWFPDNTVIPIYRTFSLRFSPGSPIPDAITLHRVEGRGLTDANRVWCDQSTRVVVIRPYRDFGIDISSASGEQTFLIQTEGVNFYAPLFGSAAEELFKKFKLREPGEIADFEAIMKVDGVPGGPLEVAEVLLEAGYPLGWGPKVKPIGKLAIPRPKKTDEIGSPKLPQCTKSRGFLGFLGRFICGSKNAKKSNNGKVANMNELDGGIKNQERAIQAAQSRVRDENVPAIVITEPMDANSGVPSDSRGPNLKDIPQEVRQIPSNTRLALDRLENVPAIDLGTRPPTIAELDPVVRSLDSPQQPRPLGMIGLADQPRLETRIGSKYATKPIPIRSHLITPISLSYEGPRGPKIRKPSRKKSSYFSPSSKGATNRSQPERISRFSDYMLDKEPTQEPVDITPTFPRRIESQLEAVANSSPSEKPTTRWNPTPLASVVSNPENGEEGDLDVSIMDAY